MTTLNELEFETLGNESPNLDLIDNFFQTHEEPVTSGRIYRGGRYRYEKPYTFGLRELPLDEITHSDDNHLVGYEPDCSKYMLYKGYTYHLIYKDKANMGPKGNHTL